MRLCLKYDLSGEKINLFWNENNTRDEMIQYALESPSDIKVGSKKVQLVIGTNSSNLLKTLGFFAMMFL
jgi:hypothetical protein